MVSKKQEDIMDKPLSEIAQDYEEMYEGVVDKAPAPFAVGARPGARVRLPQAKIRVDYAK
jgi:hypothetical protein